MTSVALIAFNGVDDLDFFGAFSVLSKAEEMLNKSRMFEVAALNPRFITSGGVHVDLGERWMPHDKGSAPQAILVPGGKGAIHVAESRLFNGYLQRARASNSRIYTICSGALLLAHAGLLKGYSVAMHVKKRQLLQDFQCAEIVSGLVQDDWLTSIGGAPAASCKSTDIALRWLQDSYSDVAIDVASRMELSPPSVCNEARGRGIVRPDPFAVSPAPTDCRAALHKSVRCTGRGVTGLSQHIED